MVYTRPKTNRTHFSLILSPSKFFRSQQAVFLFPSRLRPRLKVNWFGGFSSHSLVLPGLKVMSLTPQFINPSVSFCKHPATYNRPPITPIGWTTTPTDTDTVHIHTVPPHTTHKAFVLWMLRQIRHRNLPGGCARVETPQRTGRPTNPRLKHPRCVVFSYDNLYCTAHNAVMVSIMESVLYYMIQYIL